MDPKALTLARIVLPFALVACSEDPHQATLPSLAIAESPANPSSETAVAPLVVFLGDSLTAGSGLAEGEAYPALIKARLAREGHPVRIVNAGVSGDTSAGGLARLDWMLSQHPDIVVVALGGNDGLRGLPVDDLERNLSAIVTRSRDAGARVLLAGMLVPPNYGPDYAREFAEVYPRVAKDNDVALVPFLLEGVGGQVALNQADGIHPNARGQAIVADNVLKGLSSLLEAK